MTMTREEAQKAYQKASTAAKGATRESGPRVDGNAGQSNGQALEPELIMLADCRLDQDVFWLIDDCLPRCSMAMIFGQGGGGKTYLGASLAFGFASGRWFGYDAEPGAVLICAFERPQDAEDRFAALRDHHGYPGLPVAILKLGGKTLDERLADLIIRRAKELATRAEMPVRAIEVDTVRAALGARREDDEGLGALRVIGERVHAETGATVIWIHHEGKTEGNGPRGILTLADACSVWWRVEEHEAGDRVVHVDKANRGPCHVPLFAFKLIPFEAGRDKRDQPIILCKVEMTNLEAALVSPVRKRFGGKAQKPSPGAEAGLGDRQRLLMRHLRRLFAKQPEGVERSSLRSAFILDLSTKRAHAGKSAMAGEPAATAFRQTLASLRERGLIEENGELITPSEDGAP